jgi:hypothetical protein
MTTAVARSRPMPAPRRRTRGSAGRGALDRPPDRRVHRSVRSASRQPVSRTRWSPRARRGSARTCRGVVIGHPSQPRHVAEVGTDVEQLTELISTGVVAWEGPVHQLWVAAHDQGYRHEAHELVCNRPQVALRAVLPRHDHDGTKAGVDAEAQLEEQRAHDDVRRQAGEPRVDLTHDLVQPGSVEAVSWMW